MSDFEPCKTCPWRKSSTVGGGDIPTFSLKMMQDLRCTVGPGDAMRQIMACHYSPVGKESACRGYIARHGYSNLNVRLLGGVIPIRKIIEACDGVDLWDTFDEMLEAYESANQ